MNYELILEELKNKFANTVCIDEKSEPNIFEILQIQNKEVLFCRFLGYLLNPKSKLNGGLIKKPLESFMEQVLKTEIFTMENFSINLEEIIDENRRVDIVIIMSGNIYPIEVKINADDQKSQLFDYWNFYFGSGGKYRQQEEKIIYYLTPTGKMPSEVSITSSQQESENNDIKKLEKKHYKLLSFGQINDWLETDFGYDNISKYLLQQYKGVVENMVKSKKLYDIIMNENGEIKADYKKLLIELFDASEELKSKIQLQYLKNAFKKDIENDIENTAYELCNADEDDKKKDKYCLLTVKKNNNKICWVCANTNLYIVAEELNDGVYNNQRYNKKFEWQNAGEKYFWKYISPDNNLFAMGRNLNLCIEDKEIKILDILKNEIKQ